MIVAQRKPIDSIMKMIEGCQKIMLVGCKGCVSVCAAGGLTEVEMLGSALRIARLQQDRPLEIAIYCLDRQCDPEFVESLRKEMRDIEAILSMACGAGVQFMAEKYHQIPVFPAVDTRFIGVTEKHGIWSERCQACGDCKLHLTGGICPISRCSKSLFNGPCGGSTNGHCEINENVSCGWQLIWDRMSELQNLEALRVIIPLNDWSTGRDGGPRKIVREDLTL